jgi:hypothetical protein
MSNQEYQGFLYYQGVSTDVNDPLAVFGTWPWGINDKGQIVGFYLDGNHVAHGYRQDPTSPPLISGMPGVGCSLWPPNRKLVQVAIVTATDTGLGIAPGSFIVTGTSNEPPDPKEPDIVITPNGAGYVVQLRADRLGNGTGRVYTLTATASDLIGNTTKVTATCTVPHDQHP